jgi:hypothetical protein
MPCMQCGYASLTTTIRAPEYTTVRPDYSDCLLIHVTGRLTFFVHENRPARNRGVVFLDRPRVVRKAAPVPVRNLLNVTTNRPLHQGRQEVLREVRQALGEVLRTGAVQDRSRDLLRLGKSPSAYNNGSREGNCCLNYTLMRMLWVT